MSFDSLTYIIFLPAVCVTHWLCPSGYRWIILLLSSYVFYMSWNAGLSLLIFSVTLLSWLCGLVLEKEQRPFLRRFVLTGAVLLCLTLLGFFKYWNFLGSAVSALFGRTWQIREIILPVGISFYTFQAMSYVMDVYRGKMRAERHLGYYALYISFFSQLVAGPIERADRLLPQLRRDRHFAPEDLSAGLRLILSGFFRKLACADLMAGCVDAVYRSPSPDGSAVALATLLFGLQIYCDFSGYSEIASGSARLLGIRLMRNFDRPYLAPDIRAFWRRWHISLTDWFTDYVYIPLGGSRRGLLRQLFASTAVFALCGLWHGADWSFLVWGLVHACLMALHTLITHFQVRQLPRPLSHALTFLSVNFAWLFFRAGSKDRAVSFLTRLFSPWNLKEGVRLLLSAQTRAVPAPVLLLLLASVLLCLRRLPSMAWEEERETDITAWAGILLAVVIAALIRMDSGTANAFIYFQF